MAVWNLSKVGNSILKANFKLLLVKVHLAHILVRPCGHQVTDILPLLYGHTYEAGGDFHQGGIYHCGIRES